MRQGMRYRDLSQTQKSPPPLLSTVRSSPRPPKAKGRDTPELGHVAVGGYLAVEGGTGAGHAVEEVDADLAVSGGVDDEIVAGVGLELPVVEELTQLRGTHPAICHGP